MKNRLIPYLSVFVFISLSAQLHSNENLSRIHSHEEITIGNQIWMKKNLDVVTFQNGDTIQEAKTFNEWSAAAKKKTAAWCYFKNDKRYDSIYGKLYNFHAVSDPRGLAPSGWRVPDAQDWSKLSTFLGGNKYAGGKMKSVSGWEGKRNGTNSSGFSGLPGGSREFFAIINKNDGFLGIGHLCYWWSSAKDKRTGDALAISINGRSDRLFFIWDTFDSDGYYVRCIKN